MSDQCRTAARISVIIPYYNRARWIGRAVRSVLWQTFNPCEILIVDDASAEPLPPWIAREKGVRVVRHAKNGGAAAARNTGLRESRGELCAFLDSDDVWLPRKLEWQVERLLACEARGLRQVMVVCGFLVSSNFTRRVVCAVPKTSATLSHFASGCWFCPGSTLLARTADLLALGGYDETLARFEDTLLFFRFALHGGQVVTTDFVDCVILQDRKPGAEIVAESARAFSRLARSAMGDRDGPTRRKLGRRIQAYAHLEIASSLWYGGRRRQALFHLAISQLHRPRLRLQLESFFTPAEIKPESLLMGGSQEPASVFVRGPPSA